MGLGSLSNRIDIQHHVHQYRHKPWEKDVRTLENLWNSLVLLHTQLMHLQLAAEVSESGDLQNTTTNDISKDWNTLGENDEILDGAQGITPDPLAPGNLFANHIMLAPMDSNIPVESQKIGLPSNNNVTPRHKQLELWLRQTQAKIHLNHLCELIAEKLFYYSDLICTAPRKSIRTKARSTVKVINFHISFHCQVYSQ